MARQPTTLTPAIWELGSELRTLRDGAELSTSALATRIGRSQSNVTRWETGRLIPDELAVQAICDALGLGDERREHLVALAQQAAEPFDPPPGVNKELARLMAFEERATRLIQTAPLVIPGMLQSADYAHAIFAGEDLWAPEVERRVETRMERQETLLAGGAHFDAFIADRAFEVGPCSHDVMRGQLAHLLKISEHDSVSVRMVSLGGHYTGMFFGAFLLMRFATMAPIGHIEVQHYSSLVTESRAVTALERSIAECRRNALTEDETRQSLTEMIKQ